MTASPLALIQKGRTNCWKLPLNKTIHQPGFNARSIDYSQDPEIVAQLDPELEPMARDIANRGIQIPCKGRMVDGKFRLTDGHRRTCAVRLAIARGWLKKNDANALIPVLPEGGNYPEQQRVLDLILLNSGKQLDIIEQAGVFERLVKEHQFDEMMIADHTHQSVTHVRNCLLLVRGAHNSILAAVRSGETAATTMVEFVREKPDKEEQLAVFTKARELAAGNRITPKHLAEAGVPTGRIKNQQGENDSKDFEELVEKCIQTIREEGKASTSLFQRRNRLGYTRAAEVMAELEKRGIVGQGEGAAAREILVNLDNHTRLVIVGCGKTKANTSHGPVPAKELYTGPLFLGRRAYAEASGSPWMILSAKHGLINPETAIESYDTTIAALSEDERSDVQESIINTLIDFCGSESSLGDAVLEIHAGAEYVELVREVVEDFNPNIVTPMAGLGIGEQLARYGRKPTPCPQCNDEGWTPGEKCEACAFAPSSTVPFEDVQSLETGAHASSGHTAAGATAVTDGEGKFIAGWDEVPVEVPHDKVKVTILLVEERGSHYYGLTLKWPAKQKGDGWLHEKPQRIDPQPSRVHATLLALQRIQGELESREFPKHPEVMAAIDRHIKAVAAQIGGGTHDPSEPGETEPLWDIHWVRTDEVGTSVNRALNSTQVLEVVTNLLQSGKLDNLSLLRAQ